MKKSVLKLLFFFLLVPLHGFSQKYFYSGMEMRYADFRKTYDMVSTIDTMTFSFDRNYAAVVSPGISIGYRQDLGKLFYVSAGVHFYNTSKYYEKIEVLQEFYGKDLSLDFGAKIQLSSRINSSLYAGMGIGSYKFGVYHNYMNSLLAKDRFIVGSDLYLHPRLGAEIDYTAETYSVGLFFDYNLYSNFTYGFNVTGSSYSIGLTFRVKLSD